MTRGRVFVDLNLVGYSVECNEEAYGTDEKGDGIEFVFFFVDQINADIAWEATDKPEKGNPLFKPRNGLTTIKAVINKCCKNSTANNEA